MSGLRALHVIGGGDTGGAMAYVLGLVKALRAEECDAQLLCLGGGGLAESALEGGLPCEVLPMRGPWDPTVLPALRRHLTGGTWRVLHTHGMRANLPARTILGLSRTRPAVFTTVHSDLALDYASPVKSGAYTVLDRASRGMVDGFCCVSSQLAERLIARGVSRSRVKVVYPGIDPTEAPDMGSPAGGSTTGRLTDSGAGTVGTVARLVGVKDLGLLLEVARLLRDGGAAARVVIVGDGPERTALERQARAMALDGVVEFRGEVRPAWAALAEFDVYVLTSISEGVPLSALEAMWTGLPVVATAVGGLPEVVEDGKTGYLVTRTDDRSAVARAMADRISALLSDAQARGRVGQAARERVVQGFTTAVTARKTLRFYERVLAERSEFGGW